MQWSFLNKPFFTIDLVSFWTKFSAIWLEAKRSLQPGLQLHLQGNVTWQLSGAERGHQSLRLTVKFHIPNGWISMKVLPKFGSWINYRIIAPKMNGFWTYKWASEKENDLNQASIFLGSMWIFEGVFVMWDPKIGISQQKTTCFVLFRLNGLIFLKYGNRQGLGGQTSTFKSPPNCFAGFGFRWVEFKACPSWRFWRCCHWWQ